jgi:phosphatidylserine decarboxylase
VQLGDRIGLIRFGSRVDLFIPLHWPLSCAVGDKAVGGSTVFAHVKEQTERADAPETETPDAQQVSRQEASS